MIEIKGSNQLGQHEKIVTKLYEYIELDVAFFLVLREILFLYGEMDDFNVKDYEEDKKLFKKNYPVLNDEKGEEFFNIIEMIYSEYFDDSRNEYRKFRGDLTEFIIGNIGPFFITLNEMCVTREAVFFKEGQLLQPIPLEEHNHNIDVCFHENNTFESLNDVSCEVLECKIKIENFFRRKLLEEVPRKKKDKQDRDKIRYMEALGAYFENSKIFKIAFATLSNNVELSRKWLKEFPSLRIEVISGEMIENMIRKKAV